MQRLQQLIENLDTAASDVIKLQELKSYLSSIPPEDAAWALFFFENRRLKTKTGLRLLKEVIESQTCFPDWVIQACNERVKDTPETLALLFASKGGRCEISLSTLVIQFLQPLSGFTRLSKKETIRCAWEMLSTTQRVLFNKMILGGFQLGAQKSLIHEALSKISGIPRSVISRRLIEDWQPSATWFQSFIEPDPEIDAAMTPCQFEPVVVSEVPPDKLDFTLGLEAAFAFDGARVQGIKRREVSTIWSEELIPLNLCFPELIRGLSLLPSGTVLEGLIVGWDDDLPPPRENVQKRLKVKTATQKTIQSAPVQFIVLDIIERHGINLSHCPFAQRRVEVKQVMDEWSHQWSIHGNKSEIEDVNPDFFQQEMFDMSTVLKTESEKSILPPPMSLSKFFKCNNWASLEGKLNICRDKHATGLLCIPVDPKDYPHSDENRWRLLKPASCRARLALLSAERLPGNQTHFIRFTFGAWLNDSLVSVAVIGTQHSKKDFESLGEFVLENTLQKQGNNCLVKPDLLYEISFEDIQESSRSKSGIRLKNARLCKRLTGAGMKQASTVEEIKSLI